MIRTATEQDLGSIRALIKSVPGLWHEEWRFDTFERALHTIKELVDVLYSDWLGKNARPQIQEARSTIPKMPWGYSRRDWIIQTNRIVISVT